MAEITRQEELLLAALNYAEQGWHVFPCRANKAPFTPNGCKDATVSESQIIEWWHEYPEANIGLATGEKSDVWVLDIDVKNEPNGFETLAEYLDLPVDWISAYADEWLMQETQSGGLHIFFKYEDGIKNRAGVVDNVDVRGDGGYVVVAPSTGYKWLQTLPVSPRVSAIPAPAVLLELVRLPEPPLFVPNVTYNSPGSINLDDVEMIPKGNRDTQINRLAWSMKGRNVPLDEAMQKIAEIALTKCVPSFSVKVAQKKVRDAYTKG